MTDERPTVYRTKSGRELTDEDIEALAAEAERGYDVKRVAAEEQESSALELLMGFASGMRMYVQAERSWGHSTITLKCVAGQRKEISMTSDESFERAAEAILEMYGR